MENYRDTKHIKYPQRKVIKEPIKEPAHEKRTGLSKAAGKEVAKRETRSRAVRAGEMDLTFLVLIVLLVLIGLVMLFSASSVVALTYEGNSYYYIVRQLQFAVVGIAVMLFISRIDYKFYSKLGIPTWLFLFSTVLLILVLLIGETRNDAKRWLKIPGLPVFQPSEISKFAIILFLSYYTAKYNKKMNKFVVGFVVPMILIGATLGLIFLEKHVSGCIIILSMGLIMLFVGGSNIGYFLIMAGLIAGVAAPIVIFVDKIKEAAIFPDKVTHALIRIQTWKDPWLDKLGTGWQSIQSLLAIGSGGLFGVGLGQSRQKFLYVSEAENDFIFAIICEELGFVGALLIIILFVLLLWRGFVIALKSPDKFGTMIVIGIITLVGIQAALNIAVVTNSIPNTGISLPFFSYGGTSLLTLLASMGIVLNVSRYGNG